MYFIRALVALGLVAAAQACTPGTFACGNQNGAPGPDGAIFECNALGQFVLTAQCGGPDCCVQSSTSAAFCSC
ncbi:hypothetical protein MFIFM68171_04858 [Madurella fahalii]|uniref:Uncharacterized protein n=1 Tax=Madurella fahalii TaxID=1157608 RepID=A0ABQ0GA57_9PEZI